MNCPYCYRPMTERYDADLDLEYLSGQLKEQMKIVECYGCNWKWSISITVTEIKWMDRFNHRWQVIDMSRSTSDPGCGMDWRTHQPGKLDMYQYIINGNLVNRKLNI